MTGVTIAAIVAIPPLIAPKNRKRIIENSTTNPSASTMKPSAVKEITDMAAATKRAMVSPKVLLMSPGIKPR